jgi:hypothetical protein
MERFLINYLRCAKPKISYLANEERQNKRLLPHQQNGSITKNSFWATKENPR